MTPPYSCAVPGKKPGTSTKVTTGILKQSQKRIALYKKKRYELYENDNEEKIDYKKRNYKSKKEKVIPIYKQECLLD